METELEEISSVDPKLVGIFWDIENCAVLRTRSVQTVVDRIKSVAKLGSDDNRVLDEFWCSSHRLFDAITRKLNELNVDILQVCADKSAADVKLMAKMDQFLHRNRGKEKVLVLISGDSGFLPALTRAKQFSETEVLVIYWNNCSQQLLSAFNCIQIGFKDDIDSNGIQTVSPIREDNTKCDECLDICCCLCSCIVS